MDRVDLAIIEQLRRNCRLTNTELADAVGLTPSPCLRRVRRLEEQGVITGYHARVDPAAIGRAFEVLVDIELSDQSPENAERFEAELVSYPEVVEARRMFGAPDFELVVATKDLAAYETFMRSKLLRLPGMGRLQSRFPMVRIKSAFSSAAPGD
ncbi:Lrp/AsnC family transcriptional regulator [Microbacterium sp. NPDC091313]